MNTKTTRTAEEFIEWANEILRRCGIGTYDNSQPWYEYTIDSEGIVLACDYSNSERCDDWQSITEADLENEASVYLDC